MCSDTEKEETSGQITATSDEEESVDQDEESETKPVPTLPPLPVPSSSTISDIREREREVAEPLGMIPSIEERSTIGSKRCKLWFICCNHWIKG